MITDQPLQPFADVTQVSVSWRVGLTSRLTVRLDLTVHPERYDPDDDERRLLALQLTALDGDLLLHGPDGEVLVCGLRARSALPVASGRAPRKVQVDLVADLSADQRSALLVQLGQGAAARLDLFGQLSRWVNPLFDEQGYQHTRVGDKGMSRVIQDVGVSTLEPLASGALRFALPLAAWEG